VVGIPLLRVEIVVSSITFDILLKSRGLFHHFVFRQQRKLIK
jgi:hypothetical protein